MEIIDNLPQGSAAWLEHRRRHFNASDAPAMLGVSPYKTRNELIREYATGIASEITPEQQRIFDRGHKIEVRARPVAEGIIGEDLSPCVGTDGQYSASFDGITFAGDVVWENKTINASLREAIPTDLQGMAGVPVTGHRLPEHYRAQLEQQAMVSGCERILFTAASLAEDGDDIAEIRHCWYMPDPIMRARIVAGWEQFEKDVAAWTTEPVTAAPIGRAPETLPALRLEVTGAVTASNLEDFRAHAMTVIGAINRTLTTDADFADAEKTVKWCADAEARLKAAKDAALSQTESIEQAFRVIDDVSAELRRTRLDLDKLVKAEKDNRRTAIVTQARSALAQHAQTLNAELRAADAGQLPAAHDDFAGVIKGMRSLDSMTEAVTADLLRQKSALDDLARLMRTNREALRIDGQDWKFLFADFMQTAVMPAEAFAAVAAGRIAQHKEAEAKRLEQERERIRQEEERKAREAAEREAEAERQRIRAEEQAKARADAAHEALQAEQQVGEPVQAEPLPPAAEVPASVVIPPKTGERVTLGHINALLAPISINAAGLAELGFQPVATAKAAKLYDEGDIPAMCRAISEHVLAIGGRL